MNIEHYQESEKILRYKSRAKYRLLKNKLITILILNFIPFFSVLISLLYYKWYFMNFTKNKIWIGLFYIHEVETEKIYSIKFFKIEICQKMGENTYDQNTKRKDENSSNYEIFDNDYQNESQKITILDPKDNNIFENGTYHVGSHNEIGKDVSAIDFELDKDKYTEHIFKKISNFNDNESIKNNSEFSEENNYKGKFANTSDCYLLNYFEAFGLITGILSFLGLVGHLIIIVQLNFLIFESEGILAQKICSFIKTKTLKISVFIIHSISFSLWFLFLEGLQVQNGEYGLCFYLFLGNTGFLLLLYFWFRSIKKKLKGRKMISHLLGL